MARKLQIKEQAVGPDWYLVDWMKTLHVNQTKLMKLTDWSKATTNDIYHGRTNYYRQILNEAAAALNVEPFELLMPPARAMALRQFKDEALRVVETARSYESEPSTLRNGTHS